MTQEYLPVLEGRQNVKGYPSIARRCHRVIQNRPICQRSPLLNEANKTPSRGFFRCFSYGILWYLLLSIVWKNFSPESNKPNHAVDY